MYGCVEEMGTDNLRVSLQIIDAYVLLGQEHFLVVSLSKLCYYLLVLIICEAAYLIH